MLEWLSLIVLGLIGGTIAAALGVGGGVIYVPALVLIFSVDQHLAQGTSLAVILPTAVVATIAHARLGNVRWPTVVPVALAGVAAAALGAWLALGIDGDLLRRLFGVFLVLVAARLAFRAQRLGD